MARMIDQKPTFRGEARLWETLKAYLPDNVVVYNNREINGREFDSCVLIENAGILVIEVKGWAANSVEVHGVDEIKVEGYVDYQHSPKKQARAYRFALLNKIKERHNISPLVFDMVCYPFISKAEYLATHLNIISEDKLTIFKEDMENGEVLCRKIQLAYDSVKMIPHTDLTPSVMLKLRRDWEPMIQSVEPQASIQNVPYSVLSIFPQHIDVAEQNSLISQYFSGSKQVIFISERQDYEQLISVFSSEFAKRNLQPQGNNLAIGFTEQIHTGKNSTSCFNLEIYHSPEVSSFCHEKRFYIEGNINPEDLGVLERLSQISTFNQGQYSVEHASTENNTLVEAGAGTGKTYSMVSRIAFLCNKMINPVSNIAEEIAMVTFTNEAANNMKVRLKQMFVNYYVLTSNPIYLKFIEDTERAHISTIHSFAIELLRSEPLYTGLGTNFRVTSNEYLRGQIYDVYLSQFLAEMEEENPNLANEIPVPVYDLKKKIIGIADKLLAKSVDLTKIKPTEMGVVLEHNIPYFNLLIEKVLIPSEKEYFDLIHTTNDLDLKECIIQLSRVLSEKNDKVASLKTRFLFIDEFQDTDDIQIQVFQMLQKAINAECRFFIVGDLKQSIYRFRGATLSAFQQMKKGSLYDWDTYHLTINYRTDHRLLDQFDRIFARMGEKKYLPYERPSDQLTSNVDTEAGENLFITIPCHTKDETVFFDTFTHALISLKKSVEAQIKENLGAGKTLSVKERIIAILARSNWQVEKLVHAAQKKGLRVDTKTGGDLFQLPSTIDLYKLVLALSNSSNPLYLINLIESNYTSLKLDYHRYHGMQEADLVQNLIKVLDEFFTAQMDMTWHQVVSEAYSQPILYVLKHIYDALQPWKKCGCSITDQQHYLANYGYLMERIIQYSRIDALTLNQIAEYLRINILTGQQQLARNVDIESNDVTIICTTVHKSKGLEFGTVVLPYTDEDISDIRKVKLEASYSQSKLAYFVQFENKVRQSNSNYDEPTEIEEQISEESRILYVALTRAIQRCVWINDIDRNPAVSWGTLMEE